MGWCGRAAGARGARSGHGAGHGRTATHPDFGRVADGVHLGKLEDHLHGLEREEHREAAEEEAERAQPILAAPERAAGGGAQAEQAEAREVLYDKRRGRQRRRVPLPLWPQQRERDVPERLADEEAECALEARAEAAAAAEAAAGGHRRPPIERTLDVDERVVHRAGRGRARASRKQDNFDSQSPRVEIVSSCSPQLPLGSCPFLITSGLPFVCSWISAPPPRGGWRPGASHQLSIRSQRVCARAQATRSAAPQGPLRTERARGARPAVGPPSERR